MGGVAARDDDSASDSSDAALLIIGAHVLQPQFIVDPISFEQRFFDFRFFQARAC